MAEINFVRKLASKVVTCYLARPSGIRRTQNGPWEACYYKPETVKKRPQPQENAQAYGGTLRVLFKDLKKIAKFFAATIDT